MRLEYWWQDWHLEELLESYLPDFVLAFAFFTSVVYAVLGKRFEQQRPAIAMSVTMGLALSIGLVWWEQANGFSIKDLGLIALGFAVLLLAFVMYQSIRQVGGSWAGTGITLGASMLIAGLLGFRVPIDAKIIQTVTVVALMPNIKHSMADMYRERHLSKKLDHGLRTVRKKATTPNEHPEEAADISTQIKRMLPAQGHLTERMAQLRTKAHQIRNGHIV